MGEIMMFLQSKIYTLQPDQQEPMQLKLEAEMEDLKLQLKQLNDSIMAESNLNLNRINKKIAKIQNKIGFDLLQNDNQSSEKRSEFNVKYQLLKNECDSYCTKIVDKIRIQEDEIRNTNIDKIIFKAKKLNDDYLFKRSIRKLNHNNKSMIRNKKL